MELVLAAFLCWTSYADYRSTESLEGDRLKVQSRVVDENLLRQLEGAYKALSGISAELHDAELSMNDPALTRELKLLTDSMPGISSMLVLDTQGTIVASSRDGLAGKNFRQREYFDAPRKGGDPQTLYVSPPFVTTLKTYVVVVSRVLVDAKGRFNGVVTASLDPAYFNVVLRSVLYAPDMRTTLIHQDGKIFLNMPTNEAALGIDLKTPGSLFDRHQKSGASSSLGIGRTLTTGDERMVALRTIDSAALHIDRPMVVSVGRNLDAIFAPWRSVVHQLVALFGAVVLASSIALWLNQRRRRAFGTVAESILRERQAGAERVELALRGADLGLWDLHVPSGSFVINPRERALLGFSPEAHIPAGAWRELIHPDDRAMVEASILPHLRGEAPAYECEHRMRHQDGRYLWLSNRAMIVERDANGAALRIVGTHLDITDRKQGEERLLEAQRQQARGEERLSLALEGSSLALFDWDIAAGTMYHSAQAAAMRGDPAVESTTPVGDLQRHVHPDDLAAVLKNLKDALTGKAPHYHAEFRLGRNASQWRWVRARGRVVQRDASGRAMRLAGTYADIQDRKVAEGRLRRLAEFDSLTGLPNRAVFHERLQDAMARAARGKPMALLFLDIDRFKTINDTLGHDVGDELLKVYAQRMQAIVRQTDTVARLAGDEFTIILEAVRDLDDAKAIAGKLVESLRAPIALGGRPHEVTASIGLALCASGETDDAALLRRADQALYEAKRLGRNRYACAETSAAEIDEDFQFRATAPAPLV